MVHRWAADCVQGRRVDPTSYEAEGLESGDPVLWLRDGGLRLITALQEAPVDLEASCSSTTPRRHGSSGRGASATRRRSTPSTRSSAELGGFRTPWRPR